MLGAMSQTKRCRYARKGCTCYVPRDLFGKKGKRKAVKSGRASEKASVRREEIDVC
jgi:hypothetical protein